MKNELMTRFITLQEQIRVLHWQTTSYARHQGYGLIYDDLGDLIDEFLEIYMGKYGRLEFEGDECTINLKNNKSLNMNDFVKDNINFLKELSVELDEENDTDLLNLRDEMLAKINKLRYLLTLK